MQQDVITGQHTHIADTDKKEHKQYLLYHVHRPLPYAKALYRFPFSSGSITSQASDPLKETP